MHANTYIPVLARQTPAADLPIATGKRCGVSCMEVAASLTGTVRRSDYCGSVLTCIPEGPRIFILSIHSICVLVDWFWISHLMKIKCIWRAARPLSVYQALCRHGNEIIWRAPLRPGEAVLQAAPWGNERSGCGMETRN